MRCRNSEHAKLIAKANADSTGLAWVVLADTSGNWLAEPYDLGLTCRRGGTVIAPGWEPTSVPAADATSA